MPRTSKSGEKRKGVVVAPTAINGALPGHDVVIIRKPIQPIYFHPNPNLPLHPSLRTSLRVVLFLHNSSDSAAASTSHDENEDMVIDSDSESGECPEYFNTLDPEEDLELDGWSGFDEIFDADMPISHLQIDGQGSAQSLIPYPGQIRQKCVEMNALGCLIASHGVQNGGTATPSN